MSSKKIEVSAEQLASLDLYISNKKQEPKFWVAQEAADNLGQAAAAVGVAAAGTTGVNAAVVATVTHATAAATNAFGGLNLKQKEDFIETLTKINEELSLDDLIELRKQMIVKNS